jgi:hypothetical protein
MTSLGTELPKLMSHVRDNILPVYDSIGPSGAPAARMIRADLDRAQRAMIEGDTVEMLRAFQSLKEIEL